jgi:hypothetical protein
MPRPSDYLQGYEWVPAAHNYRRPDGTFVKRDRVLELLEASLNNRERTMLKGTTAFVEGKVSARAWVSRQSTMLQREYLQNAALAAGGWDRLTDADLARIQARLNTEFGRLASMADQIRAGEVTEAQALARIRMYQGGARREFFDVERTTLPATDEGMVRLERRLLGPTEDHCSVCPELADQGWQPEGTLPVPGEGSECLPGGTEIRTGLICKAYRRAYDGELVEIVTAHGYKLAATPNHPIATVGGWVPIAALHEGDQVICNAIAEGVGISDPDVIDVPTPICKVFDALALTGVTERVHGLPVDFHGDGREQEVNVVWANYALSDRAKANCNEHIAHGILSSGLVEMGHTGLVPSGELGAIDRRSEIMLLSQSNASEHEQSFNSGRGSGVFFSETAQRVPTMVGLNDGINRECGEVFLPEPYTNQAILSESAGDNTSKQQAAADDVAANPESTGQRQLGLALLISGNDLGHVLGAHFDTGAAFSGDTITSIRRFFFSGHVYNLTTGCHYYTANSIIVKNCDGNCRCEMIQRTVTARAADVLIGTKG